MAENTKQPKNIWQKLMDIQKAVVTFAADTDADKQDSRGKAEYKYTPGWVIVEKIREFMDNKGIMLMSNCISKESELIEYPVYKNFNGKPTCFTKKEMYVEVTMEYTWLDTETGEKAGPFKAFGFGANGTDKSGATAMSMAKRQFLMNYFNFTTREAADEQDAHDSAYIPGLPRNEQPMNLSPSDSARATPFAQEAMSGSPMPASQPVQTVPYGGMPAPGSTIPQAPAAPKQGGPWTKRGFDPNDPAIKAIASQLANYDKGTNTHKRILNESIGRLTTSGYDSTNPLFVLNLVEAGQAMREGRQPQFQN